MIWIAFDVVAVGIVEVVYLLLEYILDMSEEASMMPLLVTALAVVSTSSIAMLLADNISMISPIAFGYCMVAAVDKVSAPKASNNPLYSGINIVSIFDMVGNGVVVASSYLQYCSYCQVKFVLHHY